MNPTQAGEAVTKGLPDFYGPWELRTPCPSCNKNFAKDVATFFEVCPNCGEPGPWMTGGRIYWPSKTMRTVHANFYLWQFWKWGRQPVRWEEKP